MTTPAAAIPDEVREVAASRLRRLVVARVAFCLPLCVVAIVVVANWQTRFALMAAVGAATIGGLYGVAAYRALRALLVVKSVPGRLVRFEGWCRPTDGCNFALFAAENSLDTPFAVIRLPLVREMSSGTGWVFQRGSESAAALVSERGELLGAGRIVNDGAARWLRRDDAPPRFVIKPPDLKPPAG